MYDLVKDFWEFVTVMVVGIFGFGVMYQRNQNTAGRVSELEKELEKKDALCPQLMTKELCKESQTACREIQGEHKNQNAKEFHDIKAMIMEMRKMNADQHNLIMDHLLNGGGK